MGQAVRIVSAFKRDPVTPHRKRIEEAAREAWLGEPLAQAVDVRVWFHFARVKSNKRARHTSRPDLDNLAKAVLDSLTGIVWQDDRYVDKVTLGKSYLPNEVGHTRICVTWRE